MNSKQWTVTSEWGVMNEESEGDKKVKTVDRWGRKGKGKRRGFKTGWEIVQNVTCVDMKS